MRAVAWVVAWAIAADGAAQTPDPAAVERGRKALLERAYLPAPWSRRAIDEVWKIWTPSEKPADLSAALFERYGLPPAPYPNAGLPMGLRESKTVFGASGVTNDCLVCHGGSILGKSIVGLGNSTLDFHGMMEDFARSGGTPVRLPFHFTRVRGTSEAGGMAVYLLAFREENLDLRLRKHDFTIHDDLCEDPPAWWHLKKKQTMYHTGSSDARSVRSIMQFMLSPTNPRAVFEREEKTFADIQAFLFSLEAPKYPFPVDVALADRGKRLFTKSCAKCHGTYGPDATYPNRVVPLAEIGTDPARFHGIPEAVGAFYNRSWFAKEKGDAGYAVKASDGYQAPPLDGVWATAPYFHNGSTPTLADVLDSKSRPKLYTRSFRTDEADYDRERVGWKVRAVDGVDAKAPPHEQRKVYDTTQPGRSNAGHTYGDAFTPEERRAVVEYLKTL